MNSFMSCNKTIKHFFVGGFDLDIFLFLNSYSRDVNHTLMLLRHGVNYVAALSFSFEPRSEKTGLRGFRPGPTQTGLYSHRRWLEA